MLRKTAAYIQTWFGNSMIPTRDLAERLSQGLGRAKGFRREAFDLARLISVAKPPLKQAALDLLERDALVAVTGTIKSKYALTEDQAQLVRGIFEQILSANVKRAEKLIGKLRENIGLDRCNQILTKAFFEFCTNPYYRNAFFNMEAQNNMMDLLQDEDGNKSSFEFMNPISEIYSLFSFTFPEGGPIADPNTMTRIYQKFKQGDIKKVFEYAVDEFDIGSFTSGHQNRFLYKILRVPFAHFDQAKNLTRLPNFLGLDLSKLESKLLAMDEEYQLSTEASSRGEEYRDLFGAASP